MTETNRVHKFIFASLTQEPEYQAKLPGGIHKGVAPAMTPYPFLTLAYSGGTDVMAMNAGTALGGILVGGGILYLLKVIDRAESEMVADAAAEWVEGILHQNNGRAVDGGWVYVQKEAPFTDALVEQEVQYQQVGGTYRFFVDMP